MTLDPYLFEQYLSRWMAHRSPGDSAVRKWGRRGRQEAPHQGPTLYQESSGIANPPDLLWNFYSHRPSFVADNEGGVQWLYGLCVCVCTSMHTHVCLGQGGWTFLTGITSVISSGSSCVWDPTLCRAGVGAWALESGLCEE